MANVIKSKEILALEEAAQRFAETCGLLLGEKAVARITFEGLNPIVLRGVAESLKDEDGNPAEVQIWNKDGKGKSAYILHTLEGPGFIINQFSE